MDAQSWGFMSELEDFVKSFPEEKRNVLYRTALVFYILGAENTRDILHYTNNAEISRKINLEILKHLEERCKENKPYIPKFIYHL